MSNRGRRLTGRRRGTGWLAAVLAGLVLTALPGMARGEDGDAFAEALRRSEYLAAEIDIALRELDARQAEPFTPPPLPYQTLSINRNAVVTVGGEARVNYAFTSGDSVAGPLPRDALMHGRRGRSRIGDLALTSAHLFLDIEFGRRWRAYFDIDLQGQNQRRHPRYRYENLGSGRGYRRQTWNNNLSEGYIELLKDGHSGLGFKAGMMYLPFGLKAKPDLFTQSYLAAGNLSGSYLLAPDGRDQALLPHASGLLDPVLAAMLSYELRDIIRFEAALFQETDGLGNSRHTWDGRRSKSDQPLPRSFQIGAGIYPLEGWELSLAFRNRHSRGRGIRDWTDSPYRGDFASALATGRRDPRWNSASGQWADDGDGPSFGSRRNEQSFSVGLALEIPNTDLSVYGEYAYGWNQGFNKHIRSDNVNLGLAYRLTPRLTLHTQGEWLHVRDGSWLTPLSGGGWERDVRNNHLYRLLLGLEYELLTGLTLEGGWQYEYWRVNASAADDGSSASRTWRAGTFYMGTRFIF